MLFNSLEFIFVFLPVTLALFYAARRFLGLRAGIWFLGLASLAFYSYWFPPNLVLLVFSIVFNYIAGNKILAQQDGHARKLLTTGGVTLNLALLGYFKYFNFFMENIDALTGGSHAAVQIFLPLGISFFTFQQVAYLVDCYKRKTQAESFAEYMLYNSFFPQLIAGPIVLHEAVRRQYTDQKFGVFNNGYFCAGVVLFTLGLAKKVLIADPLALVASPVFAVAEQGGTLQFFESWGAALAYTYQLYFDFSGYSDMAIGLALMFGIFLPINFDSPYKSTSIIEFWRRWHITFSNFLRDYLYIPLGGSRKGAARASLNLLIVMFLGGLWHGAAWTFVVWGMMHGVFLVINHFYRRIKTGVLGVFSFPPVAYVLTMVCVVAGWVFFRAQSFDGAFHMIRAMGGAQKIMLPSEIFSRLPQSADIVFSNEDAGAEIYWGGLLTLDAFVLVTVAGIAALVLPSTTDLLRRLTGNGAADEKIQHDRMVFSPVAAIALGAVFVVCLLMIYANTASEFLYFQF